MEVPNEYKTAGLLNLIGGALNVITAGVWVLAWIWLCVGIFWLVPVAMGAWQAFIGFGMNNGEPKAQGKTAAIVGIVAGALNFNPFPIIIGIVALMQLGKPEVAGWLEQHGA